MMSATLSVFFCAEVAQVFRSCGSDTARMSTAHWMVVTGNTSSSSYILSTTKSRQSLLLVDW